MGHKILMVAGYLYWTLLSLSIWYFSRQNIYAQYNYKICVGKYNLFNVIETEYEWASVRQIKPTK